MAISGLAGPDTYINEAPSPTPPLPPGVTITSDGDEPAPKVKDGVLTQELPDGSLIIDFSGGKSKKATGSAAHDANLAEYVDEIDLNTIASELLDGINADIESRRLWLENRAGGLKHLALKLENPRSPSADADTAVEGQSTVRWPGLLDAVLRFQANARGELLPAGGPVKIRNAGYRTDRERQMVPGPPDDTDDLAEALETDFNFYLTDIDKAYYP